MMFAELFVAALTMRPVLVINAGDDAIFALKVGHVADSAWGDDILGFDEVIDVSHGRTIRFPLDPGNCVYDVQATYRNGSVVVKRNVNLCTADRIDIAD